MAALPEHIFKAYDVRGLVDGELTPDAVRLIGQAIGSEAAARGQPRVAVARDGRLSGPVLLDALVEGLTAAGREVIDIGMVPTPVLYYAAEEEAGGCGVMLTGSHNPPEYNGLKIMLAGETLAEDGIQALRRRIASGDLRRGRGARHSLPVEDAYLARISGDVRLARPIRAVVDCGNGVAGVLAPRLLRALGCEVIEMFCEVDGRFPNHHPDPSQPENLKDLRRAVLAQGADLGLAFDGDGDRLGVIDPQGRVIWPDRQMMLFARDVLARNPGGLILYDVKCTGRLGEVIAASGGRPLMWKTGHSLIKAKMKQDGALLAGEMSGHIFFKERWFGFDDALYAAARLLEILSRDPRPAGEVFGELPDAVNTPELRVGMPGEELRGFMAQLTARGRFVDGRRTTIDGLRVDYRDGWGLVRASNTTPCLVVRFEADTPAILARIQDEFRQAMLAVRPGLALPF